MNADILQNLVELFQKNQFTKVLKLAAPIVDQNPVDINILNIFGTAAAITGQFQLAETTFKRALAIDVNHAELNNNLGNVFLRQKNTVTAYSILNKLSKPSQKIAIFTTVWV